MSKQNDNILPNSEAQQNLSAMHKDIFADDDFEKDAAEGLADLPQQKVDGIVNHLNGYLHQKITRKTTRKRVGINMQQTVVAVVIILLAIILAFAIINRLG
jgi:glutamine synthetase adenylyltransferase